MPYNTNGIVRSRRAVPSRWAVSALMANVDIGDQRRGGHDGDHLVEQVWTVLIQNASVVGSAFPKKYQFVPSLAQREKQRQERRARQ